MQNSQQPTKQEVKTRPYYSCGKRKQPYNRSKQADANAGFKKGNGRSEVSLIKKARSQVPSQQSSASNAPYREDSAQNHLSSEDERRKQIFRLESRTAKLREDIASIQRKAFLAQEKLKDAEKRLEGAQRVLEQDKKSYKAALHQEKQFQKSEKLNKAESSKSSAKQTDSLQKEKYIQKSDKLNKAEYLTKWATKLEEIYLKAESHYLKAERCRDQIKEQLKGYNERQLKLRGYLEEKRQMLQKLREEIRKALMPAQRQQ